MSTLVPAGTGNAYDHLGLRTRVPLQGEHTAGQFALVEQTGRRGAGSPLHRHTREAETFFVLEGELDGWSGQDHSVVAAGGALYLPPDVDHAFTVRSDTAHFLVLLSPAGFETFFMTDGTPAAVDDDLPGVPGPPPPEEVQRLSDLLITFGVQITGPPPAT